MSELEMMLRLRPAEWDSCIDTAASLMTLIDDSGLMWQEDFTHHQIYVAKLLQRVASLEPSDKRLSIIASWCVEKWCAIVEHEEYEPEVWMGGSFLLEQPHSLIVVFFGQAKT